MFEIIILISLGQAPPVTWRSPHLFMYDECAAKAQDIVKMNVTPDVKVVAGCIASIKFEV